ncbi:O-antigen ligase family protein [Paraburkholderia humisilvae]|nr:O-antigen ligase family protein [Paraburkholderia humisilvae]
MTAIKFAGIGLVGAIILFLVVQSLLSAPQEIGFPLSVPLGLWAAWALLSAFWSVDAEATLHAWLDEIAYPLVCFYAFWLLGREAVYQRRMQAASWLACGALAVASVVGFHFLDPAAPKPGLLHFYARVGHTSTVALMAISVFAAMAAVRATRAIGIVGVLFCVVIGAATLNRFFWIALAVVAVVLLWPRAGVWAERRRDYLVLGTLLVAVACATVFSNRVRLMTFAPTAAAATPGHIMLPTGNGQPAPDATGTESAQSPRHPNTASSADLLDRLRRLSRIDVMTSTDTRPKIWAFYISQLHHHPWLGVGFGKPLPSIAYGKLIPASLLKLDENAKTHAHNLFLNTLLQTGVVGLALQLALFASVAWRFLALRATRPFLCRAGLALLLGMLAKNMTDDFMWQSTALMFWACCGWLLGQCEAAFARRADTGVRDADRPFERELRGVPVAARSTQEGELTV